MNTEKRSYSFVLDLEAWKGSTRNSGQFLFVSVKVLFSGQVQSVLFGAIIGEGGVWTRGRWWEGSFKPLRANLHGFVCFWPWGHITPWRKATALKHGVAALLHCLQGRTGCFSHSVGSGNPCSISCVLPVIAPCPLAAEHCVTKTEMEPGSAAQEQVACWNKSPRCRPPGAR